MAFVHHIEWGPNMAFTYGPLGFLSQPTLFFGSTAALAGLFLLVIDVAMFSLLVYWWRLKFPLPIALVLSYLTGATAEAFIDPGDRIVIPVTLFSLLLIRAREGRGKRIGLAVLGVLAGVALLGKVSDGVVAVAVLVVAAVATSRGRRRTNLVVALAPLLGTIVVIWVALGNPVGNLPQFLRYEAASASGYAAAMQVETGRTLQWWLAGLVVALVAAVSLISLRHRPRRERLSYSVILLAATWWALKEGLVRHDSHDLIFFGFMLIILAAVPATTASSRVWLLGAVTVATASAWIAAGSVPPNIVHVGRDASALRSQVATVVRPGSRDATIATARTAMQGAYALSAAQLHDLDGHTVAIEPWENAVAWAYPTFTWDPEPVLQAYSAYTGSLDELDASFLRSEEAPARILQQPPEGLDGRYPFFEPPSTWVTMTCRYAQLTTSARWQILQRIADRCGRLRPIEHRSAAFGQRVTTPAVQPGTELVARFTDVSLPITYTLSSILLKPPTAALASSDGTFRFILGTAGDLHLIRPSSTLGYSPPFSPASLDWFALTGAGVPAGQGHYEVTFYAMPMAG
jgi:hypothetical protein